MDPTPLHPVSELNDPHCDIGQVLTELTTLGATGLPAILPEESRMALLAEAKRLPYEAQPEAVSSGGHTVRQQLATCDAVPPDTLATALAVSFQAWIEARLAEHGASPFETPLRFNALALQRYTEPSFGITPHRDSKRFINVICLFVLSGHGQFFVCGDRSGHDATEIDAEPGTAVLLRAPGLYGTTKRPIHCVQGIRGTRYVLSLRQRREETPEPQQ